MQSLQQFSNWSLRLVRWQRTCRCARHANCRASCTCQVQCVTAANGSCVHARLKLSNMRAQLFGEDYDDDVAITYKSQTNESGHSALPDSSACHLRLRTRNKNLEHSGRDNCMYVLRDLKCSEKGREREREEPRTSKWPWSAQDSGAQDPGNFLFLVLNPFRYWLPDVLMHVLSFGAELHIRFSSFWLYCNMLWDSQGSGNLKEVGCSKAWPSSKSLSIRGVKENTQQEKEKEKNMQQMITELQSSLSRHMLTVFMITFNFPETRDQYFLQKTCSRACINICKIVAVRSWQVMSPKSNLQPLSIDSSKFWDASISWPPPFLGTRDFCLPLHSSCAQPWWPNPSDDPNTLGTLPTASNLYFIYASNLFYKNPFH